MLLDKPAAPKCAACDEEAVTIREQNFITESPPGYPDVKQTFKLALCTGHALNLPPGEYPVFGVTATLIFKEGRHG